MDQIARPADSRETPDPKMETPNPHASPSSARRRRARGTMTPSPESATGALSPSFSRCAFHPAMAAAPGGGDDDVSDHPYVSLYLWWLERVEGDDTKVAVAGFFRRNQVVQAFSATPIAKRHGACVLETEDGIIVYLRGSLKTSRMLHNGYPFEVCKIFLNGFPYWWRSCNIRYPRMTSSHMGYQPSPYNTSNSQENSTQFYSGKPQFGTMFNDLLNNAKSFSGIDADAFQNSSCLPNRTPRFEGYTSDDDIRTNEMPASLNVNSERYAVVCNEVDSMEICLIADSTLREIGHGDIDTNASLDQPSPYNTSSSQENSTQFYSEKPQFGTMFNGLLNNAKSFSGIDADAFQNSSCLPNRTPRFEGCTSDDDIRTNEMPASLNVDSERYAAVCNEVGSMEICLIAGSTLREIGHGDIDTNASLAPTVECANDEGNEGANDTTPISTCHKETPVASLKTRGRPKKAKHTPLNEKVVLDEDMSTSVHANVQSPEKPASKSKEQRSAHEKLEGTTRSPIVSSPSAHVHQSSLTGDRDKSSSMSTPESLKLRKTRSGRVVVPTLDKGCHRIVYNMDGSFCGIDSVSSVIGTNLPAPRKATELKTFTRRKKTALRTLKTYARKKKAH